MLKNYSLLIFLLFTSLTLSAQTPDLTSANPPAVTLELPYPNPAIDHISFSYSSSEQVSSAALVIRNILGSEIGRHTLDPLKRELKLSLSTYKPGLYFYTLVVDGRNQQTHKFLVKRS